MLRFIVFKASRRAHVNFSVCGEVCVLCVVCCVVVVAILFFRVYDRMCCISHYDVTQSQSNGCVFIGYWYKVLRWVYIPLYDCWCFDV